MDNVISVLEFAKSSPNAGNAYAALFQIIALQQCGFIQAAQKKHTSVHAVIAEAIKSAEEKYDFIAQTGAFDLLSTAIEQVTPKDIEQLLSSIEPLKKSPKRITEALEELIKDADIAAGWMLSQSLCQFMFDLAEPKKGESVYFPYLGSLQFLVSAAKKGIGAIVEDPRPLWLAALIKMTLDAKIELIDKTPQSQHGINLPKAAKVLIAAPPWGQQPKSDSTGLWSPKGAAALSTDREMLRQLLDVQVRRALIVMPPNFMHSSAVTEKALRRDLIESGAVEAIIKLPAGLLNGIGTEGVLFVLNLEQRKRNKEILFIDASHPDFVARLSVRGSKRTERVELVETEQLKKLFHHRKERSGVSRLVPLEEIVTQDFNLSVDRYLRPKKTAIPSNWETERLTEIADVLRPMPVRALAVVDKAHEVREASLADIGPDGVLSRPQKSFSLSPADYTKSERVTLKRHDILLVIKGSVGRLGIVEEEPLEHWVPNQSFVIIRLRNSDPTMSRFIFRYLCGPGQAEIAAFITGTLIKHLPASDIRMLSIPVPPPAEVIRVAKQHEEIVKICGKIKELQGEVKQVESELW